VIIHTFSHPKDYLLKQQTENGLKSTPFYSQQSSPMEFIATGYYQSSHRSLELKI